MHINVAEDSFSRYFQNLGYLTTKRGYPDFLIYKETETELLFSFVEVKVLPDTLSKYQKTMISLMKMHGIPVEVMYGSGAKKKFKGLRNIKFSSVDKKEFKKVYRSLFLNAKKR